MCGNLHHERVSQKQKENNQKATAVVQAAIQVETLEMDQNTKLLDMLWKQTHWPGEWMHESHQYLFKAPDKMAMLNNIGSVERRLPCFK